MSYSNGLLHLLTSPYGRLLARTSWYSLSEMHLNVTTLDPPAQSVEGLKLHFDEYIVFDPICLKTNLLSSGLAGVRLLNF